MKNVVSKQPEISLIIPILNEVGNLDELSKRIDKAFKKLPSYEVIYVDDGSKDNTLEKLEEINKKYPHQKFVSLMRTSGQSTALMAGIDNATGKYIATLDGDLQNYPEDLIPMYKVLLEGKYDMMVGWRKHRWHEKKIRRLPSLLANFFIKKAFRTGHLHDAGCSVKIANASLFREIRLYGELHRFIAYIAHELGGRVGEMEVQYAPRKYGVSKYGLSRTFKVIVDIFNLKLLMMRKTTPTQLMAPLVLISLLLSFLSGALTLYLKIFNNFDISGDPLFVISVITFLMSIQFAIYGFLGELIIRAYYESGDKKTYLIREKS